jgi:hypothetical protein
MKQDQSVIPLYMVKHIDQWQSLGISKKQYCKQSNLSYHKFQYWCIKHNQLPASEGNFIPLSPVDRNQTHAPVQTCSPPAVSQPWLELLNANGTVVRFYQPIAESYLKHLLK